MVGSVVVADLGTTGIKALVVSPDGAIHAVEALPAPVLSGEDRWFDPDEYVDCVVTVLKRVCTAIGDNVAVEALCFSSQRATLLCIGKDGEPVGPAWSWQGTSCASEASCFFAAFGTEAFRECTGLLPSPIYSVSKLAYLRHHQSDLFDASARFCSLQDFVLRRLGADGWFVDHSNASAMGLYDVAARDWGGELLDAMGIGRDRLSSIMPAGTPVGTLSRDIARRTGLPGGTPLCLGGGDQQCALLGSGAAGGGDWLLSLGTSAVAMMPMADLSGNRPDRGLVLAHVVDGAWSVEGFMNAFGSCVGWAGRMIGLRDLPEMECAAASRPRGSHGTVFVPFLAGVGCPEWDGDVRGAFFGLSQSTERGDLARAVLEGLCCEVRRVLDAVRGALPVGSLSLVGGARGQGVLPGLLAGITGVPVTLAPVAECAALGAAALAFAFRHGQSPDDVVRGWQAKDTAGTRVFSADEDAGAVYASYLRALAGLSTFHRRRLAGNG